jgi:hypothetical protein
MLSVGKFFKLLCFDGWSDIFLVQGLICLVGLLGGLFACLYDRLDACFLGCWI